VYYSVNEKGNISINKFILKIINTHIIFYNQPAVFFYTFNFIIINLCGICQIYLIKYFSNFIKFFIKIFEVFFADIFVSNTTSYLLRSRDVIPLCLMFNSATFKSTERWANLLLFYAVVKTEILQCFQMHNAFVEITFSKLSRGFPYVDSVRKVSCDVPAKMMQNQRNSMPTDLIFTYLVFQIYYFWAAFWCKTVTFDFKNIFLMLKVFIILIFNCVTLIAIRALFIQTLFAAMVRVLSSCYC